MTSRGCGSVTQLAEGDPKCIRIYTDNIKVATHLAEGDLKKTSPGIFYARLDASGASEVWELTVQFAWTTHCLDELSSNKRLNTMY